MKKTSKIAISSLLSFSIISLLSCNNTKVIYSNNKSTDYKINRFKPLDYKKVFNKENGKYEPVFYGGINYTAYTQGISFIFNILKGLGWNWEDAEKIRKLYDNTFDFNSINIMQSKSGFKNRKASNFEKEFHNYFTPKGDYYNYKSIGDFIKTNTKENLVAPNNLYNQIKSLVYIDKDLNKDQLLKVDASTKVEVPLPGFKNLTKTKEKLKMIAEKLNDEDIMKKIFQGKKYAYSWSGEYLSKLGFQIQDDKIIFWHISDSLPKIIKNINLIRKLSLDLESLIKTSKSKQQKNLSQVPLDPFGSLGSMPNYFLFTNLILKNTNNMKNYDTYFKNLDRISKGRGRFDWNANKNLKDKNNKMQNITSFNSFIDGKNPGSVILKMFEGKTINSNLKQFNNVAYPLKSFNTENLIQTFYRMNNKKKIKDIVRLIHTFIKFLKEELKDKKSQNIINLISGASSPIVKSFFEFIKNNEITENDIRKQFDEYNNGSHYMLAVEIFLRGMINIPEKFTSNYRVPFGVKIVIQSQNYKRKSKEIVGMTNVNSLIAMIFMMYTSNKKYLPEENEKKKILIDFDTYKIFHFNPQNQDFDKKYVMKGRYYPRDYFIMDLQKYQKSGREIDHYPL